MAISEFFGDVCDDCRQNENLTPGSSGECVYCKKATGDKIFGICEGCERMQEKIAGSSICMVCRKLLVPFQSKSSDTPEKTSQEVEPPEKSEDPEDPRDMEGCNKDDCG